MHTQLRQADGFIKLFISNHYPVASGHLQIDAVLKIPILVTAVSPDNL